jgi:hypothetical protein
MCISWTVKSWTVVIYFALQELLDVTIHILCLQKVSEAECSLTFGALFSSVPLELQSRMLRAEGHGPVLRSHSVIALFYFPTSCCALGHTDMQEDFLLISKSVYECIIKW